MKKLFAVYGASGFGREVMPLARSAANSGGASEHEVVFIDDNREASHSNGHRVLSFEEFTNETADERYAALAIADSKVRESLAARCLSAGIKPWSVRASNVVELDAVVMGEGAVLCPFVMLTSNIHIGRQFHANIYSYVAHDCVIGDYVTFAPSVKCNGNVVVEDHAYIGTGAVIKQGRPGDPLVIGRGAIVGMGAVVTRSVAPGATVVGNPARPLAAKD